MIFKHGAYSVLPLLGAEGSATGSAHPSGLKVTNEKNSALPGNPHFGKWGKESEPTPKPTAEASAEGEEAEQIEEPGQVDEIDEGPSAELAPEGGTELDASAQEQEEQKPARAPRPTWGFKEPETQRVSELDVVRAENAELINRVNEFSTINKQMADRLAAIDERLLANEKAARGEDIDPVMAQFSGVKEDEIEDPTARALFAGTRTLLSERRSVQEELKRTRAEAEAIKQQLLARDEREAKAAQEAQQRADYESRLKRNSDAIEGYLRSDAVQFGGKNPFDIPENQPVFDRVRDQVLDRVKRGLITNAQQMHEEVNLRLQAATGEIKLKPRRTKGTEAAEAIERHEQGRRAMVTPSGGSSGGRRPIDNSNKAQVGTGIRKYSGLIREIAKSQTRGQRR